MSSVSQNEIPVFSTPVRWVLRVLAWLAFGVASYLAWHAANETSVAGCGLTGGNGCDMVLASKWSKWLGIPVAIAGLGVYASLAGLSVLLGLKDPRIARWINTAFVLLATVAAGASLWFIGLQLFAIGSFCLFCIITDLTGIALGVIAIVCSVMWLQETRYLRQMRGGHPGMSALRSALPTPVGARLAPIPGTRPATPVAAAPTPATLAAPRREWPTPSLPIALGGAGALLLLLAGGQIVFPGKTHELAKVDLSQSINMDGGNGETPTATNAVNETHQTFRPETGSDAADEGTENTAGATDDNDGNSTAADETPKAEDSPKTEDTPPVEPTVKRERLVKLLGGKLTLDVYKHPLIGSPEAPHVMVEMVSYDCAHCRKMHKMIKKAHSRYGDQVAIIVMVVPLERTCNKLITAAAGSHPGACSTARMALGVAAIKPSAFVRFHDWLMSGDPEKPPSRGQVVTRAYEQVDSERLRSLSGGDQLKKQIEGYVDLFGTLSKQKGQKFGLPVQILGDHVMSGSVESQEELNKAWEEHLGVVPKKK